MLNGRTRSSLIFIASVFVRGLGRHLALAFLLRIDHHDMFRILFLALYLVSSCCFISLVVNGVLDRDLAILMR